MLQAAGACLLSALLVVPADAGLPSLTRCWTPNSKVEDNRTLSDILACQERARSRYAKDYAKETGQGLPLHMLEQVAETQRGEVRAFLQAFPDRAAVEYDSPAKTGKQGAGTSETSAASGILDFLAKALGMAKEKLHRLLGASDKPPLPKNPEAAAALGIMKRGRMNLEKDPAGALKRAVGKYNSDLDQNLDPEMKKFYKKDR